MRKIKWAFIGCGKVVLKNKKTPFINSSNTVVAITTTSIDNSQKAKEKLKLKNCNIYDDVNIMLEKEKIDAIYICTPPKYHYEYLKLLKNFKGCIYVEKPILISNEYIDQIEHMYRNRNNVYVAHYKRLTPKTKRIKQIINQNKVGNIIKIEGNFERLYNKELLKSWIYKTDISGGGRVYDIIPHIIDCIYYIFGDIKYVNSKITYNNTKHDGETDLITNLSINNVPCKLEFHMESPKELDIINVYGDKGLLSFSINRNIPITITRNNKTSTIKYKKTKIYGIECIKEIDNIIKHNKSKKNICTLKQALHNQRLIHKIIKRP